MSPKRSQDITMDTENGISRRRAIVSGAAAAIASGALLKDVVRADAPSEGGVAKPQVAGHEHDRAPLPAPGEAGRDYVPVVTPNGVTLPFRLVDGVKVFHLVAEEFEHEFAPGLRAKCWGYNGRTPGPTIEVVEGDRVRIYVSNRLPEPTTIHWHGILLPAGM